jgi:hypothetical protein
LKGPSDGYSSNDLEVLIAAWNKPFAEIEGQTVNNIPLICADFDHEAQGTEKWRAKLPQTEAVAE